MRAWDGGGNARLCVDTSVIWVWAQHADARLGRIGRVTGISGVTWTRAMWCTGESRFRGCARVRPDGAALRSADSRAAPRRPRLRHYALGPRAYPVTASGSGPGGFQAGRD